MDLTFLPLPNDVCRIISIMKHKIEMEPVMKEIIEHERPTYTFFKSRSKRYLTETYTFNLCGNFKKLCNIRSRGLVHANLISVAGGRGYFVEAKITYKNNNIIYNLDTMHTIKAMKNHLRDNKIKGYSKLNKAQLKKLCLSF